MKGEEAVRWNEAAQKLQSFGVRRRVERGQQLRLPGAPANYAYRVERGLLAEYHVMPSGKRRNKAFIRAGEFGGSLSDLFSGGPSTVGIDVLQEGVVWVFPFDAVRRLANEDPAFDRVLRGLERQVLHRKAERERMLLTLDARQRVDWLREREPGLLKETPAYHLASYLAMAPETLSRLLAASA